MKFRRHDVAARAHRPGNAVVLLFSFGVLPRKFLEFALAGARRGRGGIDEIGLRAAAGLFSDWENAALINPPRRGISDFLLHQAPYFPHFGP